MAACDIAIAADDAKIGFPEARRGLLPAIICDVLSRKVREGDLSELFLTGEPIDATRAQAGSVSSSESCRPNDCMTRHLIRRTIHCRRRTGHDPANQNTAQYAYFIQPSNNRTTIS